MPDWYRWDGNAVVITLRVVPRARRDEVVGPHGGALKVRITAPPVDGAANAHLVTWFAKLCKVPKARVIIESGEQGRSKRIRIVAPVALLPGMVGPAAAPN